MRSQNRFSVAPREPDGLTSQDLLSYRSRCFVLDVRAPEEFAECHFQSSVLARDTDADVLASLPKDRSERGGLSTDMWTQESETRPSRGVVPQKWSESPLKGCLLINQGLIDPGLTLVGTLDESTPGWACLRHQPLVKDWRNLQADT